MSTDRMPLASLGPPIKRRAGLRSNQAGRGSYRAMREMVITDLRAVLRSLCSDSVWNYAVFWKLNHQAPMVLTLADAYYDNCERYHSEKLEALCRSRDPLGLAVMKMSCRVYTLGEGIVGQVAITGKHQWIFADNIVRNSWSPAENGDVWQSQFLAGVKTVAVVAIVPNGVVQLGSLKKITENMKLVSHMKNVIMAQDSSLRHIHSINKSSVFEPISSESLVSRDIDCLQNLDKVMNRENLDAWMSAFPQSGKERDGSDILPSTGNFKNLVEVNKHGELESSNIGGDEIDKLHRSRSSIFNLENSKLAGVEFLDNRKCTEESSDCKDMRISSTNSANPLSYASDCADLSSTFVDFTANDKANLNRIYLYHNEVFHVSEPSDFQFQSNLDYLRLKSELGQEDTSSSTLMFPSGCELHEALGPAFMNKSIIFDRKSGKVEDTTTAEMPEGMNSSQMTSDSCPEHLLEAVVAKVCHTGSQLKSEKSFCKSMQSLLTFEKYPEPSSHTKNTFDSENYCIEQPCMRREESQQRLSSAGICGVIPPTLFSSPCPSAFSEQQERSSGPAKNNKRARSGETSKPRPRDRQLIQDRIKELRELTPNGAKCSIDSLLERTIKHMLFLQGITKHANKLYKCDDAKLGPKETSILGSAYEKGSSWAVEVGGNLKVCSIVVENLNKNGQMVVEMMSEEGSHFLEIAEAIRSLGLTILKGATEACGDKTWICFIIEGQNNRNIHRMDILWSLVRRLQPKNPIQQQF